MIELNITLAGKTEMSRSLLTTATMLEDFTVPLTAAAAGLQKTFQLNFDTRGATFGGWAPRTKDQPWPLLEKTGTLRKSFYTNVMGNTATLGNNATYFGFHQLGTRKMPQRLMMKLDEASKMMVVKCFQAYIIAAGQGLIK